MPRIIFKCNYLKNKSARHITNTVKYIATRDGVDKMTESEKFCPATDMQNDLIEIIIKDAPDTQEFFEYSDYESNPTIKNATEFINSAIDSNYDLVGKKKNYVDYIANRPKVDKIGTHGLFSTTDDPIVIAKVAEEISQHTGNVWTNIISLRREDATRLGYDNAKTWMALLRSHATEIAVNMKISPENFRWYAAMHNESNHPHVHMIAYSVNPKEGYLTENGIEKIRADLAKDIFRQDLMQIYTEQTKIRDNLTLDSKNILEEIVSQIDKDGYENKIVEALMVTLFQKLNNTSGKKVYGYLTKGIKEIVDRIVDELSKDERLTKLYDLWYEQRYSVLKTYTDTLPPKLPLSQQKEFKSIKNLVIHEAMNLAVQQEHFKNGVENEDLEFAETALSKTMPIPSVLQNPISDPHATPVNSTNSTILINPVTNESPGRVLSSVVFSNNNVAIAVSNLFRHCGRILNNEISNRTKNSLQMDRKLQQEIDEKKQAHGIRI